MKQSKQLYIVEMTDTFGGEANYAWVNRFLVQATTPRGAMRIVTNVTNDSVRLTMSGEVTAYDSNYGCVRYFVEETSKDEVESFTYTYKDLT